MDDKASLPANTPADDPTAVQRSSTGVIGSSSSAPAATTIAPSVTDASITSATTTSSVAATPPSGEVIIHHQMLAIHPDDKNKNKNKNENENDSSQRGPREEAQDKEKEEEKEEVHHNKSSDPGVEPANNGGTIDTDISDKTKRHDTKQQPSLYFFDPAATKHTKHDVHMLGSSSDAAGNDSAVDPIDNTLTKHHHENDSHAPTKLHFLTPTARQYPYGGLLENEPNECSKDNCHQGRQFRQARQQDEAQEVEDVLPDTNQPTCEELFQQQLPESILEEGLHQPGAFSDGPSGFILCDRPLSVARLGAAALIMEVLPPTLPALAPTVRPSQPLTNNSESSHYNHLAVAHPVDDTAELPAAEQMNPTKLRSSKGKVVPPILALCAGLVTVVLAAVVAMAVTLSKNDSADANSSNIEPTMAPTSHAMYTLSLFPQYTLDAIELDEESPQSRAFTWLMEDPLLHSHPDWRIIQKFALATFFYATGGEDAWIHKEQWLNHSVHECLWYSRDNMYNKEAYFVDSSKVVTDAVGPDVLIGIMDIFRYHNPCEERNPSQVIAHGVYKNLWLWSNHLKGTLPLELYMLKELHSLGFDANMDLGGTLSPLVGELRSLQALLLSAMDISGSVPTEVGLLHNLTVMHLFSNQLTGSIPSELGQLSRLSMLMIDQNRLSAGIPTELGLLTNNLVMLTLSDNALVGSIPTELGQLSGLGGLLLYGNALTGSVATELGRLRHMKALMLFSNKLTSSIPTEVGLLTNIRVLQFDSNQLTSNIPTELGLLTELQDLELYVNQLTSTIPTELGLLTKMSLLYLFENSLVGSIPTELGLLTKLTELLLDSNQLISSIPTELALMTDLEDLQLYDLQLLSSIPTEIGLLTNLTNIVLMNNALTGSIPSELGLLTNLENLLLSSNQLTSMLPTEIGKLTSLWVLQIFDNYLSGSIPTEVGLLANSTLPTDYGANCTCLGLTLNDNLFEGKIPSQIGQISDLPLLLLQGNQLTGEIPQEIFALALKGSLQTLNVTRNQLLSGIIPVDVCLVDGFDFGFDCTPTLCGCDCVC